MDETVHFYRSKVVNFTAFCYEIQGEYYALPQENATSTMKDGLLKWIRNIKTRIQLHHKHPAEKRKSLSSLGQPVDENEKYADGCNKRKYYGILKLFPLYC